MQEKYETIFYKELENVQFMSLCEYRVAKNYPFCLILDLKILLTFCIVVLRNCC